MKTLLKNVVVALALVVVLGGAVKAAEDCCDMPCCKQGSCPRK